MTSLLKRLGPPLCPVLLAVFPLLSLFAQNQSELELSVLWLPLFWTVASAVVTYGVFLLVTRRAERAGVLASLVMLAFFYYGVLPGSGSWWFTVLWLLLSVAGIAALLRTTRDLTKATAVLGVVAAVLALPKVVTVGLYHANHAGTSPADARLWPTALAPPAPPAGAPLPDIYVIVPDDYERLDVLKQYFKYDDSEFAKQLEQRGFVLSPESVSPYSDSESNIAALLNMDYLSNFPKVLGAESQDVRPVKRVIEDNRAARLLATAGYDYVHLDTDEVTFAGGNPDISPFAPPDSFANLWLTKSVLGEVGGPVGFDLAARNARYRHAIRSVFGELDSLPAGNKPKFVVFHTLLPHDPYVYDERGKPITYDAADDADLSSETGRTYYLHQLQHLNRLMLASVDRILATAKTPPVIVIQADEGFSATPEDFGGEDVMKQIRVKGLSAFYLPGHHDAGVPSPANSVNDLRFVFNQYLGTHYDLLESASYGEGDLPYDYTDKLDES